MIDNRGERVACVSEGRVALLGAIVTFLWLPARGSDDQSVGSELGQAPDLVA